MHPYAQVVAILCVAVFIWYALSYWVVPAALGNDKRLQWVELTRLIFLVCYVLGFFRPVSDHVMAMSFFGSLAPEMQRVSLQLIEAIKNLSSKDQENESRAEQVF